MSQLHQKWLLKAGFNFGGKAADGDKNLCEVASIMSYAGEGLETHKTDGVIDLPYSLKEKVEGLKKSGDKSK